MAAIGLATRTRLAPCLGLLLAAAAVSCGAATAASVPVTPAVLGTVLAGPPSGYAPDTTSDQGPIVAGPSSDAHAVAAGSAGDTATVEEQLVREGFTRAYGRWYFQNGVTALATVALYELVIEFMRDAGASDHLTDSRLNEAALGSYRGAVDTPGLPSACAGHLVSADGFQVYDVFFTKGNLLFRVSMGGFQVSSPDAVLAQARKQHRIAPAGTLAQPGAAARLDRLDLALLLAGAGALLVVAVAVLAAAMVAAGWRPAPPGDRSRAS